jgi:subfamily B ATP-binding cassette protein MsbA
VQSGDETVAYSMAILELILPKEQLRLVARLLSENWRQYAPRYAVAFVFMFIVAGCTGAAAYLMKDVINLIFVDRQPDALVWIPIVVVSIYVAKGAASYFQEVLLARIGNSIVAGTQRRLYDSLLTQDLSFFQRRASSDLIVQITQIAQSARSALNILATSLGRDLMTLGSLVAVMVVQQPVLFLICAIGAPIGAYAQKTFMKRLGGVVRSELTSISHIVNTMRETSQGIRVVKAFTLEEAMRARMDGAVRAVERLSNKLVSVNARVNPLVDTLGGITVAAVIVYAGWRSLTFNETPGEFFSFITALLMAYEPARRLGRVQLQLSQACIMLQAMYDLIDSHPSIDERTEAPALSVPKGEIRLDDVTFSYERDANVLTGLTLTAEAGKTTALVGLSGSGKTTIMNLILRFWDPQLGAVRIDGQDIRNVRLSSLRSKISLVSQDVFLFTGTVRENIAAGLNNATEDAIIAAAKAAHAHHFIESLPKGYDTQVGELGGQLSGGQRQRISIARAFLKNAPVILLDEPTSALDSESEQAIQRALAQLTERRTTLVIAHRLATVLNADRIHVIEKGRLAESGTHRELIAAGGIYARLYDIQYAQGEREAV